VEAIASLSQWKQHFPGRWLALRVTGHDGGGEPIGPLLACEPSEEALLRTLRQQGVPQALVVCADDGEGREYVVLFSDLLWRSSQA